VIARAAVVVALVLAIAPAHADGDDGAAAFRAAEQLLGAGELEAAQAAYEAVANRYPDGPWADGALLEAGELAERRGDLDGAIALWQRLLDDYPTSREARRARARMGVVSRRVGEDGAWVELAEQVDAIQRAEADAEDSTPHAEAMTALIASHPDYPQAFQAQMWTGDTWLRLGLPARAAASFAEARATADDPAERWRADKAHADALTADGRLDDAARAYRGLYGRGDVEDRAVDTALAKVAKIRQRAKLRVLSWLALAASLIVVVASTARATRSARGTLRALIRPPIEVLYFAPVALVLIGVALTGNQVVGAAVQRILAGGLITTWLVGASLEASRRASRLRWPIVLLHLVVAVAAIASVCFLAVFHDQLIDMIAETWAHGHDMH